MLLGKVALSPKAIAKVFPAMHCMCMILDNIRSRLTRVLDNDSEGVIDF